MSWYKSSFSANDTGCVEVYPTDDGGMKVRDSKDQNGPVLTFNREEWRAFIRGATHGEFGNA
jgi:Domain of unknown function (DUF397)